MTSTLRLFVAVQSATASLLVRGRDQRGEGVISAAIAVLVMAFLGAAMWLAFKGLFASTTAKASSQVDQIGG